MKAFKYCPYCGGDVEFKHIPEDTQLRHVCMQCERWNVPAGYMENGETIEEGAQRELVEEANAKVTNIRPHLIYSLDKINQVYILFLGDLVGPTFSNGIESLDVQLFSEAEIPWKALAFTSSAVCIKRYFENKDSQSGKVFLDRYLFDKKE